ncbi:MAG TPA: hypothetical protein VF931_04040 [Steroidobacteraceae bacterium]
MRSTRLLAALFGAALLGLAPAARAWKLAVANEPHVNPGRGYAVQFPVGWKFDRLYFSDETGATRDGPALQAIFVDFREHKKAFKAIKKESSPDMLPQELAELLVADMTKERGLENVAVQSNEPAMLAGRPGFRLRFEYKLPVDRGAVRMREVVVGTAATRGFYLVGYRAPVLYYFDRDLDSFGAAVQSFTITDPATKPN